MQPKRSLNGTVSPWSGIAGERAISDDQLLLASRLYYLDELSQSEVARIAGVSQSKISRMLALARAKGIVQISVPDYDPRRPDIEQKLQEKLGLKEAIVIRTLPGLSAEDLRHTLGYFAGPILWKRFDPRTTVALAGGRSIRSFIERMSLLDPVTGITFVQAMGNIDSSPGPYDAIELCRTMAGRWRGHFLTINSPVFLPDADTCRRLLSLEQVGNVMHRISNADHVLVGIGTLDYSVFVERNILSASDLETLQRAGGVGEILGRFYNAQGKELDSPFRDRIVSLPLKELRKINQVTAIVAGGARTAAIQSAVTGGIIKSLVIDETSAQIILNEIG